MARRIYLMSGHTSKGELRELDGLTLDQSGRNILVLNLSGNTEEELREKGDFLEDYFGYSVGNSIDLGRRVDILERETSKEEAEDLFGRADLVYLPGGNTEALIWNIEEMGLEPLLRSFERVISGNSAGAYALCLDYLKIRNGDLYNKIPALGFVNFCVKCHYTPEFDPALLELSSEGRTIYGIEDRSAVVWDKDLACLGFFGKVWRFSGGEKEKVS